MSLNNEELKPIWAEIKVNCSKNQEKDEPQFVVIKNRNSDEPGIIMNFIIDKH